MRGWHHNQRLQRLREFCQRHSLPLLLGVVATIVVLVMWQQLLKYEQLHMHQLVQQEAISIEAKLGQELSTRILTLEQMASRWQFNGGTSKAAWEADAAKYIADFSGYQAIEWVDPSFHVRWVVPVESNEAAQNIDLSQESRRQITLSIARDLHQTLLTRTITLAQGGKGMLAVVPLFVKNHTSTPTVDPPAEALHERFDGFIVGVFRFQALFDSILTTSPHYRIQIFDHNGLIYSQGTPSTPVQPGIGMVQTYGADWQVQVLPTSDFIATGRSLLPEVVLWGGLGIAWTLAFTISLRQRATRQVHQIRRINRQLQDEMIHRQQTEASLRQLVSHMNVGFVVHAPDTHILQCNTVACELLGLSMDQMLGKEAIDPVWHFVREDGTPMAAEEFPVNLVLSTQASLNNYVLGINRVSQSRVWVLVTAFPEFDANQQIKQVVVTFIDISQLKQAERNLQEMTIAMENAISGISRLDTQGHYLYVNQVYADIIGYQPEEMVGMDWQQTVHPDDLELVTNAYQRMLQDGKVEVEAKGVRKDGSVFYKQLVMITTYNEQEQFVGHYCFVKDISDRKQAETALEKELLRSKTLFNTSIDGIVILNHQGNVVQTSPSFAQMLGYTVEETLNLNLIDWDAQWTREELQQILEKDILPPVFETRHRRKDGSIYDTEISYSRVVLDGEMMHFCICRDISDRKQAEIALQNSQARFAGILEIASDAIISVNGSQHITLFNKGAERIFGYTAEEILGQSLCVLMPDRFAQAHCHHVKQYAQSESQARQMAQRGAIFGRRKDGTEFPAEASISKLNLNGEIIFTTFLRDISERVRLEAERQQVEEALRRSEATKQAIIQAIPDLLIRMRADGSYVEFVSNNHFNIFNPGQYREKVNLYDVLPIDLAQLRIHHTQQALQSGEVQVYEHEIWIEGKQCYEEVRIVPLQEDEVLVMVRDTTDRKQFEEDLRYQKEMFQVIIDHIPVMIALFNDQGRIDFINPEFERILGWSLQEWQQRDVMVDLYPDPIYLQSVLDHMTAAIGNWKDFTTLTATKQQIETSWANVPISKERFLGIGQDISDRKRKEDALRQAMEAAEAANLTKSMFLANMSHELRTPLNVILGFAQVMSHDSSLTSAQLKDLQTIQRSGDHLLGLINDVLDLSKIEAGHCTLEESGFDLISLLHTLRTMMVERATAKQLQLTFEIAPEVPQFVIADEQKLRQVLLNLLSNAIKFTKQGSVTLRVTSWESSEKTCLVSNTSQKDSSLNPLFSGAACILQFEVSDTGVGIAETEQESIFDAFAQAEAGRQSMGGTGLGLTISRRLLELMDGSISVKSTLGLGSTFTVTVPVCPTSGVDGQVEQQERTIIGLVPGQRHRRILVVDDQPENRRLLVRLLTRLGLEVQEATNGQEAIALWQQWQPDLTWMDIRMPGLDGYEATKQIRAMEPDQASIIIALTAQASQSDRALALAAGCNDYISKPFREETLFLKLKEYLGLEYVYAEATDLSNAPSISTSTSALDMNAAHLSSFDPVMLTHVSADWLETLEDLALCGNDRAIVDLTAQLPPELESLKTQLLNLANRFEFEQIVHLIHRGASP